MFGKPEGVGNDEFVSTGGEEWSPAYTSDQLFLEICRTKKKAIIFGTEKEEEINWYYAEAAAYARRMSAGDFRGKNAKNKPVFHLDLATFSSELKAALVERAKTSKESIHRVVEDGVFKLLRARHEIVFFEHIENEPLRWEFF
jgi:hypothetical protein